MHICIPTAIKRNNNPFVPFYPEARDDRYLLFGRIDFPALTMSESNSPLLRAAIQHSASVATARFLANDTNTGQGQPESSAFFMFAVGLVGLIALSCLYCMFHVIRIWCCGPDDEVAVARVTDGFSFSLSSGQRRAVLEAIFSDTSKVSRSPEIH